MFPDLILFTEITKNNVYYPHLSKFVDVCVPEVVLPNVIVAVTHVL